MKRFLLVALFVLIGVVGGLYLHLTGKLLYRQIGTFIEVNGVPVDGDVLSRGFAAVVTRRDAGKNHSYWASYAGDMDMEGNVGTVFDCGGWVAPRLWIMPVRASDLKNCRHIERLPNRRYGLCQVRGGEEFVTPDGETITLRRKARSR